MSGRNWEPEDGMGFAGLVPTLAEKREEADRQRAVNREIKLRAALAASQREREQLQALAQTLVDEADKILNGKLERAPLASAMQAMRAALASPPAAPVQAEGEE